MFVLPPTNGPKRSAGSWTTPPPSRRSYGAEREGPETSTRLDALRPFLFSGDMTSPPKKPCKGCKSTVEVIQEQLKLHRDRLQKLEDNLSHLYEVHGINQGTLFDPDPNVPEAPGNVPIESSTKMPINRGRK